MDVIDYEIEEINKIVEQIICNSKVVVCLRSLIRIDIKQTVSRQITVCIRFPSNYPNEHLLVELKSPMISGKLLDGLTTLAEQKASEIKKPQTLCVLKFIDNYLRENPLCIAFDEIAAIKALLKQKNDLSTAGGELKCLQKTSMIALTVNGGNYYYKAKFHVPEEYPTKCIYLTEHKSNLPQTLLHFINGQAKEIARKCTEAPLRSSQQTFSKFEVKPSLFHSLKFIIEAVVDFHNEVCPVCESKCLPINPSEIELKDTADNYVERVFCGHIYHLGCLKKYFRTPPFPPNGKTCPSKKSHPRSDHKEGQSIQLPKKSMKKDENTCNVRISHDRWGLHIKLAEARWIHQQARKRELEEVKDFLQ